MIIPIHLSDPGGTYVGINVSGESAHYLIGLMRQNGILKTSRGGLHVTCMYDEKSPCGVYGKPVFEGCYAEVKGVKVLGDKSNIAAFELNCPELHEYHAKLKVYGYTHSFDDYLPHISVLKDFNEEQLEILEYIARNYDIRVKLNHAKFTKLIP